MNAMNHMKSAKKLFRWLAYAGVAAGIVGIILQPARTLNVTVFALVVAASFIAVALLVFFLLAAGTKGAFPNGFRGGMTVRHWKIIAFFIVFPCSMAWSEVVFLGISTALVLAGLAILYGYGFAPDPDAPSIPAVRREHPPVHRLQAAVGRYRATTQRPLSAYSAGEIAAHADLIGRNGRVKINRQAKTATVMGRDGYRATYRLTDGTFLSGNQTS